MSEDRIPHHGGSYTHFRRRERERLETVATISGRERKVAERERAVELREGMVEGGGRGEKTGRERRKEGSWHHENVA